MTIALQKAFEAASQLPDAAQDDLAAAILEEVRADALWESSFTNSLASLEELAAEALREHRGGRTHPDYEKLLRQLR